MFMHTATYEALVTQRGLVGLDAGYSVDEFVVVTVTQGGISPTLGAGM
jgi:hypothetical protein